MVGHSIAQKYEGRTMGPKLPIPPGIELPENVCPWCHHYACSQCGGCLCCAGCCLQTMWAPCGITWRRKDMDVLYTCTLSKGHRNRDGESNNCFDQIQRGAFSEHHGDYACSPDEQKSE